jgi:small subunit ribosomal protein S3
VKIVPAGAKLPDHFEIIVQEKAKPAQKGVATNAGTDGDNEPALPDDIDHVGGQ